MDAGVQGPGPGATLGNGLAYLRPRNPAEQWRRCLVSRPARRVGRVSLPSLR